MNIYFRGLKIDDANLINELRQNEQMEQLIGGVKRFVSIEREKEWIKSIVFNDSSSQLYFAICNSADDELLGYTSISDIDFRIGSCFWSGIKVIPRFHSQGVGKIAGIKILHFVFDELRMERCIAKALQEHEIAIKYLENLGYKKEGLMRHDNFKDGEFKNTWLFSILREEYLVKYSSHK